MAAPPFYTILDLMEYLVHLPKYGALKRMASEKQLRYLLPRMGRPILRSSLGQSAELKPCPPAI